MNAVDLNLDMMNLVKDLPDDHAVFYFLTGEDEDTDFLFCKGNLDLMAEALAHLMGEHEDIKDIVANAVKIYQE